MSKYIEAGLLARRPIRRFLLRNGVKFVEEKGLFDSVFYLDCSDSVFGEIGQILKRSLPTN